VPSAAHLASANAKATAEQMVETYWSVFNRGILRLRDEGDDADEDAPLTPEAVTPG
jgi:hypothetical protein